MLLTTPCKACKRQIIDTYMVSDRIKFAQKYGEERELTCVNCGLDNICIPDDFKAIANRKIRLTVLFTVLGLSIIGTILPLFLFDFYSLSDYFLMCIIAGTPLVIFMFYIKHDIEAIRMFNRMKLRGHNVNAQITSTSDKIQINSVEKGSGMQGKINKMNKDNLPSQKKQEKI